MLRGSERLSRSQEVSGAVQELSVSVGENSGFYTDRSQQGQTISSSKELQQLSKAQWPRWFVPSLRVGDVILVQRAHRNASLLNLTIIYTCICAAVFSKIGTGMFWTAQGFFQKKPCLAATAFNKKVHVFGRSDEGPAEKYRPKSPRGFPRGKVNNALQQPKETGSQSHSCVNSAYLGTFHSSRGELLSYASLPFRSWSWLLVGTNL